MFKSDVSMTFCFPSNILFFICDISQKWLFPVNSFRLGKLAFPSEGKNGCNETLPVSISRECSHGCTQAEVGEASLSHLSWESCCSERSRQKKASSRKKFNVIWFIEVLGLRSYILVLFLYGFLKASVQTSSANWCLHLHSLFWQVYGRYRLLLNRH